SDWASRQGHHLLQVGLLLFLFALLVGLVIPKFAVPRLGLSVYLLGIMQGTFLAVLGLLWPKLKLTQRMARVGFWLKGPVNIFTEVTDTFADMVRNFSALCGDLVPQSDLAEAAKLTAHAAAWTRVLRDPQCLWHSDLRADNVLFDAGIRALYRTAAADGVFCYTFFKAVGEKPRRT
ncbi:MAG: hypothetical protein ACREQ3_15675, partial [Candidatus Binatia bacterium]